MPEPFVGYGLLVRRFIGRLILKVMGWKAVGGRPDAPKLVALCAPHTSNWDYVIMLAVSWSLGLSLAWLGKDALFKGPLGWFMRRTGGISVDRSAPQGLVGQMVDEFGSRDELVLAIPAEGTRSRSETWKSGFYRISQQADVPYVLAFVDAATKTAGFGPMVTPSGHIEADMDIAREFYADKVGLKPDLVGPIRLREENDERPESRSAG